MFFNSPTDLVEKHVAPGTRVRLGGLVAPGSLVRGDNLNVRFEVTDGNRNVAVTYQGILPDLFREGQGVVTEGALAPDGVFKADNVLAKHDENYMPKEVADALKKSGHWKEESGKGGRDNNRQADHDGAVAMIAEIGLFALVLALAARGVPVGGAAHRRAPWRCHVDADCDRHRNRAIRLHRVGFRGADNVLRAVRTSRW